MEDKKSAAVWPCGFTRKRVAWATIKALIRIGKKRLSCGNYPPSYVETIQNELKSLREQLEQLRAERAKKADQAEQEEDK